MSINMEKENDEKLMIFVVVIDIQSKSKNLGSSRTGFLKISHEMVSLLSSTHSTVHVNTWSTSQVDFSTHSRYMDTPSWFPTNREKIQKNLPLQYVCNNPRPF